MVLTNIWRFRCIHDVLGVDAVSRANAWPPGPVERRRRLVGGRPGRTFGRTGSGCLLPLWRYFLPPAARCRVPNRCAGMQRHLPLAAALHATPLT